MPTHTRRPLSPITRVKDPIDRTREMEWLGRHRHEYEGQYVAIEGDELIAHGTDDAAADARSKRPFFARIPIGDSPPSLGGF